MNTTHKGHQTITHDGVDERIIPVYIYKFLEDKCWEFRDADDNNAWLLDRDEMRTIQEPVTDKPINVDWDKMHEGIWTIKWGPGGGQLRYHTNYITSITHEKILLVVRPQHVHHFPMTGPWKKNATT